MILNFFIPIKQRNFGEIIIMNQSTEIVALIMLKKRVASLKSLFFQAFGLKVSNTLQVVFSRQVKQDSLDRTAVVNVKICFYLQKSDFILYI